MFSNCWNVCCAAALDKIRLAIINTPKDRQNILFVPGPNRLGVYAPDRKSERPIAHLEGYKGHSAGRRPAIASSPTEAMSALHSAGRTFGVASMSSPYLVRHRSPAKRSNVVPGSTPSRKTPAVEVLRSAEQFARKKAVPYRPTDPSVKLNLSPAGEIRLRRYLRRSAIAAFSNLSCSSQVAKGCRSPTPVDRL